MAAPTMLIMPFPSPEEKYPQRIVIADITKEMEIILSAGMPSSSISELAENNCSNCPGKHSIKGTAIVYSKGRIGISASLFLKFIKPPYGIAKK